MEGLETRLETAVGVRRTHEMTEIEKESPTVPKKDLYLQNVITDVSLREFERDLGEYQCKNVNVIWVKLNVNPV